MVLLHPYFYVICVLFNPLAYQRRYDLHRAFEKHIRKFGVQLVTVELAFNNQSFVFTDPANPNHIQLKTEDYLWYKENLINIALSRLPDDCQYVAWIDADIEFSNENLIYDTISQLETNNVVQLFEYANFLGPNDQLLRIDTGFGWSYATDQPYYSRSYIPFKIFDAENTQNRTTNTTSESAIRQPVHNTSQIIDTKTRSKLPVIKDDLYESSPRPNPPPSLAVPSSGGCCIIVSNDPFTGEETTKSNKQKDQSCAKTQSSNDCPVDTKTRIKSSVIIDHLYESSPRPNPSSPRSSSDPSPPRSPCCIIVSNDPVTGDETKLSKNEKEENSAKTQSSNDCPVDTKTRIKSSVIIDHLYESSPRPNPSSPRSSSDPSPPRSPCCIIVSNESPKPNAPNLQRTNSFVYWHPGYAWAAKKSTLLKINGLFDKAILGASDRLMAYAFVGKIEDSLPANSSETYRDELYRWGKLVDQHVAKRVGFVNGTIRHFWHGSRNDRQYVHREKILQSAPVPYDPTKMLFYDENKLIRFRPESKQFFFNSIKNYFNNRREDNFVTIGSLI